METVTFSVSSFDDVVGRFKSAMAGRREGNFVSFVTAAHMYEVLTAKRWQILNAMLGAGPLSIRELARRLGRDVKAVHGDVQKLLFSGVIDKHESGGIVFPYDAIHVDFMVTKAA